MKKKIVAGLLLFSAIFLAGGIYIVAAIETGTSRLDKLIRLHQVEILREHYLIQIKRVQADVALRNTRHPMEMDVLVRDVVNMGRVVNTCFDCHHTPAVTARLQDLRHETDAYEDALSRILTIRANAARRAREEDNAFRIGEALAAKVRDMIAMTSGKLGDMTERSLAEIERTKYILYLLLAVSPLLAGVLAYAFVREFTGSVNTLLDATRRLKGGDLDHRVAAQKDEFGELASAFNEMAGSLQEQMRRMQRAEQMVVAAELAAGLAHEIKNPLAGIKVAMSVLSGETTLSEEDRGVLGKVIGEVSRVEVLLKNFLNFTKPPKPRLAPVRVDSLLGTTLALYLKHHSLPPGEANRIEIVTDIQPVPVTSADPMQLQQVVLNVVLNAISAMPAGGMLTIRTRHDPEAASIRIEISDTGKGINAELTDKIFQPFFTTKAKGTGLGLAISKQLVEQQGGSIGAANNPAGGATFTIRLPVTPAGEGPAA